MNKLNYSFIMNSEEIYNKTCFSGGDHDPD